MPGKLKIIRYGGMYTNRVKNKRIITTLVSTILCGVVIAGVSFATLGANGNSFVTPAGTVSESSAAETQSQNETSRSEVSSDKPVVTDTETNGIPPLEYDSDLKGEFGDKEQKVYVFNDVAYEVFYGDNSGADAYSDTINKTVFKLKKVLGSDTLFYDLVIPTRSEFTLPDEQKIKASTFSQKLNIERILQGLSQDIKGINVIDTLMRHRDEYIYFNTDSTWTALGAYYGYTCLGESMGFTPAEFDELNKATNTVSGYVGLTAKGITKESLFKRVKQNSDTVEYYDIPVDYTVKVTDSKGEEFAADLYYPAPTAEYAYAVFLFGGEYPVMTIKSKNPPQRGRNLLIIKDNSANAIIPYLTCNFDEITVVDYRYFSSDLNDVIKNKGIGEVLFLNGIMDANTEIRNNSIKALLN
ncbi:MAG: hypothetical protein K6F76_04460 [Clostridiales bacterium]|nr:hypothetical protein [Clostridiales bacterium]